MVAPSSSPGIWQWKFRIGDKVKTGKVETTLGLLAIRRVQLRINRELQSAASEEPCRTEAASDLSTSSPISLPINL
jgi:hypothetical protein